MIENAANALLKGLEEPPAGAVFVLVSHRPSQLLPTIRSRCVALAVPIPPRPVALQWLAGQGVERPERWLAYAGGSPRLALDYAAKGQILERFLQRPAPIDERDDLEGFADALQKIALDCALTGLGLPPKYQAASIPADPARARAWLRFARQMAQHRELTRHPLNPKLFSAQMLAEMPAM
jgi:DNA polymerase-3 subunit delta'